MTNRVVLLATVIGLTLWSTQGFAQQKEITVAADGSGEFKTVQEAVNAAPQKTVQPVIINIKPGTYKERILVPKNSHITFRGEDPKTTVLTWNYSAKTVEDGKELGTSKSYSTLISAWDFTAENITFENSAGEVGQAVALRTTGQRNTFKNCRILGWQDTLYVHEGRSYFKDCYVEGRVDFIFGRGTAVFENCTIHSKNGGYVTAAATDEPTKYGIVFLNCKLTGEGEKAYLGRPWRPFGAVTFIQCELGDHIRPEGWHNWGKTENEATARFAEYKNTGPGADRAKRVAWAKELSDEEAAAYTVQNVLAGDDKWDPTTK